MYAKVFSASFSDFLHVANGGGEVISPLPSLGYTAGYNMTLGLNQIKVACIILSVSTFPLISIPRKK